MSKKYWTKNIAFYDTVEGQVIMEIHTRYEGEPFTNDVTYYYSVRPDDSLVETWDDL